MISRRKLLKGLGAFAAGGVGLGGYALGIEPWWVTVTRYRVTPPGWPAGLRLKLAVIADLHASEPWMPERRVREMMSIAGLEAPATRLTPRISAPFCL